MARIPVEHENRGGGWWKWLLGLVAIGLVIWLVVALVDTGPDDDLTMMEDQEQEQMDPYGEGVPQAAPGDAGTMDQERRMQPGQNEPVTSIDTLEDGASPQQMAGRRVQLSDIEVDEVVNDSTFYVRPAGERAAQTGDRQQADMRALVVLDGTSQVGSEAPAERDDLTQGQRIRMLEGSVEEVTDDAFAQRDMDQAVAMEDYYLRVDRLDVAAQAGG